MRLLNDRAITVWWVYVVLISLYWYLNMYQYRLTRERIKTQYMLLMWWCINWLHNGFRTRTGGWEFRFYPWCWHILSIPLKAGRGISAETCGLDDVFPPDDVGSDPCTPFIIYIPHIIAKFLLVIKINYFYETYIPKVGVAMLAYWLIWYCLISGVLSVVWSSILYVMVWI